MSSLLDLCLKLHWAYSSVKSIYSMLERSLNSHRYSVCHSPGQINLHQGGKNCRCPSQLPTCPTVLQVLFLLWKKPIAFFQQRNWQYCILSFSLREPKSIFLTAPEWQAQLLQWCCTPMGKALQLVCPSHSSTEVIAGALLALQQAD